MWFIIGTSGLLPYSFFARAELVGEGDCTEVARWGGVEGGMFPELGKVCFKKGGPYFCNKERREERGREGEDKG